MKLIVGLGNPGAEYQNTRHNIGFITVGYLAEQLGVDFNKEKFFARIAEANWQGEKLLLMLPQTFMNKSGQAVRAAVDFYKLDTEDILVIFDDMDLAPGDMRMRQKGSAGGHNGMKDIINMMGNDQNIARIKLGISHPKHGDVINYVLGKFNQEEQDLLRPAVKTACEAALCWATDGTARAMNRFNQKPAKKNKKNAAADNQDVERQTSDIG